MNFVTVLRSDIFSHLAPFQRYSHFSVVKATLESQMSVCLSVSHQNPSASQNCSYWPSCPSAIMPIGHHAHQPSCPSAIMPIGHHAHRPSCPSAILPIGHHAHQPSCTSAIVHISHCAHLPSCSLIIMPISHLVFFRDF